MNVMTFTEELCKNTAKMHQKHKDFRDNYSDFRHLEVDGFDWRDGHTEQELKDIVEAQRYQKEVTSKAIKKEDDLYLGDK